jgi:hypothetical protein
MIRPHHQKGIALIVAGAILPAAAGVLALIDRGAMSSMVLPQGQDVMAALNILAFHELLMSFS